jgi:poly [ADP-ribose] polymerase
MSKKYCKLVMVSASNNNKYYEMEWDGKSSQFSVKYGRVESTVQTGSYDIYDWDSKYREKIRKGYTDVTDLVTSQKVTKSKSSSTGVGVITDKKVLDFMTKMYNYTNNLVSSTYSVKADSVTQKQVDKAQELIDDISKLDEKKDWKKINDGLVKLYTTIPRRMGNVKDYIIPHIDVKATVQQEQANLDAMAGQVSMLKGSRTTTSSKGNILDNLGVRMKEITPTKEMDYLMKQIKNKSDIKGIFEVDKDAENKIFDKWMSSQKRKQTRILVHGTRCSSVIPIMEIGLKIRPAGNFQFSGKAFGEGNYFSEHVDKSLGYTDYGGDGVLLVYEVHTGNPYVYNGWYVGNSFTLNYANLSKKGYDSTYVKSGNGMRNSEIIAYKEEQCRIKYIIWIKN